MRKKRPQARCEPPVMPVGPRTRGAVGRDTDRTPPFGQGHGRAHRAGSGAHALTSTAGFTLVELAVTLLLAGILLAAAAPGLRELVQTNRMITQANEFLSDLMLARSEAEKRVRPVVVCRTGGTSACSASGAAQWERGWMLFVDADEDRVWDNDDAEPVLLRSAGLAGSNTLRADANFSHYVAFLSTGLSRGNGGLATGVFRICDDRGTVGARELSVSMVGRPSVSGSPGTGTCP